MTTTRPTNEIGGNGRVLPLIQGHIDAQIPKSSRGGGTSLPLIPFDDEAMRVFFYLLFEGQGGDPQSLTDEEMVWQLECSDLGWTQTHSFGQTGNTWTVVDPTTLETCGNCRLWKLNREPWCPACLVERGIVTQEFLDDWAARTPPEEAE